MDKIEQLITLDQAKKNLTNFFKKWIVTFKYGKTKVFSSDIYYLPFYQVNYGKQDSNNIFLINAISKEVSAVTNEMFRKFDIVQGEFTENVLEYKIDENKIEEALIDRLKFNRKTFKLYRDKNNKITNKKIVYYPIYVFYIKNKKYDISLIDGITGEIDFKNKCYIQQKLFIDDKKVNEEEA